MSIYLQDIILEFEKNRVIDKITLDINSIFHLVPIPNILITQAVQLSLADGPEDRTLQSGSVQGWAGGRLSFVY